MPSVDSVELSTAVVLACQFLQVFGMPNRCSNGGVLLACLWYVHAAKAAGRSFNTCLLDVSNIKCRPEIALKPLKALLYLLTNRCVLVQQSSNCSSDLQILAYLAELRIKFSDGASSSEYL